MRYARIADKVANVTAGRKTLEDKKAVYRETMFRGNFDELVRRGFLTIVDGPAEVDKVLTSLKTEPTEIEDTNAEETPAEEIESTEGGKKKKNKGK